MKTIKEKVEYILKWYPESRDNDKLLYYLVLSRKYHAIDLADIVRPEMPTPGTVLRMRRLLKDEYPPTNNEPRLRKEAEMRVFLKEECK